MEAPLRRGPRRHNRAVALAGTTARVQLGARLGDAAFGVLGLGGALLAVLAATRLSPSLALTAVGAAVLVPLVLQRPELGALVVIVTIAVVPQQDLAKYGVGTFEFTDLVAALTVGAWLLLALARPASVRLPSRGVTLGLLLFLGWAILGVYTAHVHGTPLNRALNELRPLLSLALVFPLVSQLDVDRMYRGLWVLLGATAVSALVTIGDYLSGHTQHASYASDASRVLGTPIEYPVIGFLLALILFAHAQTRRARCALFVVAVIDLTGVFFTLQRGAWIAILVALPVTVLSVRPGLRVRVGGALLAVCLVAVVAILAANAVSAVSSTNVLRSGLDRLQSVSQAREDISGGHRLAEWSKADSEIRQHPVAGIGLGSSITFWSPLYDSVTNRLGGSYSEYYIHSSYIWLALKLGLVGAVLYLGLLVSVLVRAVRPLVRAVTDPQRILAGSVIVTLVTLAVLSVGGPHLTGGESTPLIAAAIAALEVVRRSVASAWRPL